MGEGQGVAPEEPLEGGHADGHEGQPYQGQGGLAAGQPGVEEADAGNHEQDEGRARDDPGKVTGLREESR